MHGQPPTLRKRLAGRALGSDRPDDLGALVALFGLFAIADRWSQLIASGPSRSDIGGATLILTAIERRWWAVVPLVPLVAVGLRARPQEMLCRWSDLQHGAVLRRTAVVVLLLLTWQNSLYDINYLADQTHLADRFLLIILGLAASYRPVLLIPFVIQFRIIERQFVVPFDTSTASDVVDLAAMALLAIAAGHVRYVVSRRRETGGVILVITAAVVAHFFVPGRAKLAAGWLGATDVANLPLSSYTAGWLRYGDGALARFLAELFRVFHRPLLIAALVVQLGSVIALVHRRLTMIWLLIAVGFHLAVFVTTGWWFLAWVVIEVALLRILFTPRLDDWHRANANPARIVVTMLAATVAAPLVFHPPELTWLDSPVVYGYEVEATGESGTVYHVPNAAFAPHAQELALARLQLGPAVPASGPYGGVPTVEELEELEAVTDLAQLRAHEATLGPPTLTVKSEELVKSFMEQVNRGGRHEWFDIGPPSVTWTSRGEPSFDYDEPLTRLEVWLVRGIHDGDETIDDRELVLVLTVNEGGQVLVAGGQTLGSSPVGTDGAEDAGGGDDAGGADPDTGASGNGTQTTNPAGGGDSTGATDPPPTNATVTSPAGTG